MHFQTSTGNSFGPTALPFFILLSAFFTSSLLTQFSSSLTTSASSVLGPLLFSLFINFSKVLLPSVYHCLRIYHNITVFILITFTCCTSFPALSLSAWPIRTVPFHLLLFPIYDTNLHTHVLSLIATAFFALLLFYRFFYYFHLLFYPTLFLHLSFMLS